MADWRHHRRENGRNNVNNEPGNRPRLQLPMVKHVSGKKSAYMFFLQRRGYAEFRSKHGYAFEHRNRAHQDLMSEIYKSVPSQQIDEWKREALAFNSNRHAVKENRDRIDWNNRELRHQNRHLYSAQRKAHEASIKASTGTNWEMKPFKVAFPVTTEDLKAITDSNGKNAMYDLRGYLDHPADMSGNPLFANSYTHHLISVFPLCYSYRGHSVRCYPAEICITNFDLRTGVKSHNSIFVQFNEPWWLEGGNDTMSRAEFSHLLGVPESGPENALNPSQAFHWVVNQLNRNTMRRFYCDFDQYFFVYYGLKTLADYTGNNAQRFFNDAIHEHLVPIQRFAYNIIEYAPLNIRKQDQSWTMENVNDQFRIKDLIPLIDQNHYCERHEVMPLNSRLMCARAHNARLLYHLFIVMKAHHVTGFRYQSCHATCIRERDDSDLPELAVATTKSDREMDQIRAQLRRGGEQRANLELEEVLNSDSEDDDEEYAVMYGPNLNNRHHDQQNFRPCSNSQDLTLDQLYPGIQPAHQPNNPRPQQPGLPENHTPSAGEKVRNYVITTEYPDYFKTPDFDVYLDERESWFFHERTLEEYADGYNLFRHR